MSQKLATRLRRVKAKGNAVTGDAATNQPSSSLTAGLRTQIDASVNALGETQIVNYRMPGATPLDYSAASLLRTARLHEIVNACLRIRSDSLIAPRLVVERKQPDGTYAQEDDHPLVALFRAPGPSIDMATLWRCMSISWDSTGLVFLEPLYTDSGILAGLNPLDPSALTQHYDRDGHLDYLEWWPGYGPRVKFQPHELIVRRTVLWAAPPPLVSALAAVDSDQSMTDYVRAFFHNAGIPSGILKVKGEWSRPAVTELQARWTEKYGRYGLNAGGPAVLDDNADYQRVGANMNELESESLRSIAESRIHMVFGVPPLCTYSFVGLLRAQYSNLKEAWASYWDSTASPMLVEWQSWVTRALLVAYEDPADILLGNVRAVFDKRGVGPYVDDSTALIAERREGLAAGAVTVNEYRAAAGLEARADGDVYLRPATTVPFETKAHNAHDAQDAHAQHAIAHNAQSYSAHISPRLEADVARYVQDQYARARRVWLAHRDEPDILRTVDDALDDGLGLVGILGASERKLYAEAWKQAAQRIDWQATLAPDDVTSAVDSLSGRCTVIAQGIKTAIAELVRAGGDVARVLTDADVSAHGTLACQELSVTGLKASHDAYTASGRVGSVMFLSGAAACNECKTRDGESYDLTAVDLTSHVACGNTYLPRMAARVEVSS